MSAAEATIQEKGPPVPPEESEADRLRRQILEIVAPKPRKLTYEEFLATLDEDTLAEWVDGEIVRMSPAKRGHQNIADFLLRVIADYVEVKGLGEVISAPFQMKLERGREPDLLFVAKEHLERLKEQFLDGPADLVVEIASDESRSRDRGEKFYEYASGGVPEYWLIDPDRRWAEFYQLEGTHYRTILSADQGIYHSRVLPGFWLKVEWLWQDPLPPVLDVVRQLGLI